MRGTPKWIPLTWVISQPDTPILTNVCGMVKGANKTKRG